MSIGDTELARYRARLEADLAALERADERGQDSRKTVELDQQSVGRLSRMDALQHQAMAQANHGRRAQAQRRLLAALARIEAGEFGECSECGEDIPRGRLDIDPAVPTCVSCAQG